QATSEMPVPARDSHNSATSPKLLLGRRLFQLLQRVFDGHELGRRIYILPSVLRHDNLARGHLAIPSVCHFGMPPTYGATRLGYANWADTALARYFGTSERFWLNLQARYDLEIEKDRLPRAVNFRAANRLGAINSARRQ